MITLICTKCSSKFKRHSYFCKDTKKPFCGMKCYGRWQKNRSFIEQDKPIRSKKICSTTGCDAIHFGKGFCRKHYAKKFYDSQSKSGMNWMHNKIIKDCLYCLKPFTTNRIIAKFCSFKCMGLFNRKPFIIKKGYKKVLNHSHPRSDGKGYVFEHIIVMESIINRPITKTEVVHHRDHNKTNNHPSNLMLFKNNSEHIHFHNQATISK